MELVEEFSRYHRGIAQEAFFIIVRHSQRERFSKWAFRQLRSFIEYKAKVAGVPVEAVDARDTSRTCPRCGTIDRGNRPERNLFRCVRCYFSADYVAALNIAKRAHSTGPLLRRA